MSDVTFVKYCPLCGAENPRQQAFCLKCFDGDLNTCRIDRGCRLKMALKRALSKFFAELDDVTLADMVGQGAFKHGIPVPVKVLPKAARSKA